MQRELTGNRELIYSKWHRLQSIRRFVDLEHAQLLNMIDVDCAYWVEYKDNHYAPCALIETARDVGQSHKCGAVLSNLGKAAKIPALVVLYQPTDDEQDIKSFRVGLNGQWETMTPRQYANLLVKLRSNGSRTVDQRELMLEEITARVIDPLINEYADHDDWRSSWKAVLNRIDQILYTAE